MADRRAEPPYTNGQVDRAGRLLLQGRQRAEQVGVLEATEELDGQSVADAIDALWWWRGRYARPLSNTAARLRYHVGREGGEIRGRIEVAQRLKRLETMVDKLSREQGRITQMHDIGGVRAVLPSLHHVYAVRRRLVKTWTIIRERDYIAQPKGSGYRALHLIVRSSTRPIEVQLRTLAQDHWANEVEDRGSSSAAAMLHSEPPFGTWPSLLQAGTEERPSRLT